MSRPAITLRGGLGPHTGSPPACSPCQPPVELNGMLAKKLPGHSLESSLLG
jgi:hypothetical protein